MGEFTAPEGFRERREADFTAPEGKSEGSMGRIQRSMGLWEASSECRRKPEVSNPRGADSRKPAISTGLIRVTSRPFAVRASDFVIPLGACHPRDAH